ncbi:phospholipase A1 member A-like isoform X2 [Lutzomyia longipalpis]|uniref:phospholipase A1 member A-like isoform X2 n=1 Tax=Lutzomyia longipalpis TaxID=7200 RepID=UPI002484713C|nr:phospholipase A1 member A-like isoform X2 [Lutzomyia longipalpis]
MVLFLQKRRRMDFLVKIYLCATVLQCEFLEDTSAQGIIAQALFLGDPTMYNNTMENCIWKRGNDRDQCPDPDMNMILYTNNGKIQRKTVLDMDQADWLRNSGFNPEHESIILIHGYAGGDDTLPMVVLRDAYLRHEDYNVFVADWGALAQPPCYVAAVHNLRPVARCFAKLFTFLRDSGLRVEQTTCVGHSLGAHVCGLMANYLTFRLEKIIGLDPARPLVKLGNAFRLDSGDAKAVQVLHTNAGHYGESGRIGHVDFCINNGKRQPFCSPTSNIHLCSHIWSICYLGATIFSDVHGEPCSRRCGGPAGQGPLAAWRQSRNNYRQLITNSIPMGHKTPNNAFGTFCLRDENPPFCPRFPGDVGDQRCCVNNEAKKL